MNEIREKIIIILDHLENYKCLCKYDSEANAKDMWYEMYRNSFEKNDFSGSNHKLLCISFIRLTGEIYVNVTSEYHYICSYIQQLFEVFLSEELWTVFVHYLKHSKDKHLVYTFIKAFCIILYVSDEVTFCHRINQLLNNVKENTFEEMNNNILDFFLNLVDYNFKPWETNYHIEACNNAVPNAIISFSDLFQRLCVLLSEYWGSFMKQFSEVTTSRSEIQNLNTFLILWQKLIEKYLEHELFHIYLNEQFVIVFLSNAYNLNVISLRIYADIIMQFFTSRLDMKPSQKHYKSLEEAATSALDKNFFNLLPRDFQISGFCTVNSSKGNESSCHAVSKCFQKCDYVIAKKITFIFLNIVVDFRNKQLAWEIVLKVFEFVKENFDISSVDPVYKWILDVFIDQDDILLGIMLALLRIYVILKEEETPNFLQPDEIQSALNPHEIFISFLQRIGFDHNELLAFLTSNETCFLVYILQYLKILLKEWDIFIKAHMNLIRLDNDIFQQSAADAIQKPSSELYVSPVKKLVSYSSSSSEEDSSDVAQTENKYFIQNNYTVIRTLINLKQAIKKHIDEGEFPYNILPLIALLQACENRCLSL